MRSMIVISLSFLLTAALHAQSIDELARATMESWRLPGMAVAVVKDDQVVYLKGFGVREIGKSAPITPDTLFQIASTSKAFTTTALAMLADEKKLEWDDSVREHLPYFHLSDPCADSLVTLRDIVSHRTGLRRHDELWDYGTWSREDIIRRIGSVELTKPFRSAYQYHNIMFMTAGEVVASAAGTSWNEFVDKRIFDPLGMKNTVVSEEDWLRSEHASAHRYDVEKKTINLRSTVDYTELGPAGAIKSSARDLAQWVRFQLNGGMIDGKRLLSESALEETWKPHTPLTTDRDDYPVSNISAYGLGWRLQDYRGELLVWHSGSLNYYRAQVAMLPNQKAGIVLLTNMNRGYGIIALRNALLDHLIGKETRDWNAYFRAHEQKLDDEEAKSRREREAKRHTGTTPSRELAAYAGTYMHPAYGELVITSDGNGLALSWQRVRMPLTHYHFDTFSAVLPEEDFDERLTFDLGPDGEVKSLELFGEEFVKNRTPPAQSSRSRRPLHLTIPGGGSR